MTLVGAAFIFAMHPERVGPGRTSRGGAPRSAPDGSRRWRIESFGLVAVVLVVVANFAGVFVYKVGSTAVTVATGVVSLRRRWNAKVTVESDDPAADGDLPLVAFARLDRRAPERVTTAAARSLGLRTRDVDYLVLQDVVGLQWRADAKGGEVQVTASPDGRRVG